MRVSSLAVALALLALSVPLRLAQASIVDDIAAAKDLSGRVSSQLDAELFCDELEAGALDRWAAEIASLRPAIVDWNSRKGSSAKWSGHLREAEDVIRVTDSKIARARKDLNACLDWNDVRSDWQTATSKDPKEAAAVLLGLVSVPGTRTQHAPYMLPRYGLEPAGMCEQVLDAYVERTRDQLMLAPFEEPDAELARMASLETCAKNAGSESGLASRRALIKADMQLQKASEPGAPGDIASSLKAALTAMPDEMRANRQPLIEAVFANLQTSIDEAKTAASQPAPTRAGVMSLWRLQLQVAEIPHAGAAELGASLKQATEALLAAVEQLETEEALAPGLKYDPSTKAIEAAIAYGKKNRTSSVDSFRREWFRRVGVGQQTVEFMVATPFFNVAVNAYSAARSYDDLSVSAARRYADEFSGKFAFYANFIVSSPSDVRDYKTLVKVGERVVRPVKEDRDSCSRVENGWLCSITGYFPMDEIPADSKVTLVLLRGSFGKEVAASFDLNQLR